MPHLFSPYTIRGVTLRNRVVMSPMAMYSAQEDGLATEWHLVHYGARAIGRVGLILQEVTAIEPRGRITRNDLGLWDDAQVEPLTRIVRFCQEQGALMGVQLGHAGRKAWSPERGHGPTPLVAPSAVPFADWVVPQALTIQEIDQLVLAWRDAAERAHAIGYNVIEIHSAHGYLLHQFLSPLSNWRADEYGGSLENRRRLLLRVVDAVRTRWPDDRPLFVRVSATDWEKGGLQVEDLVEVARSLKEHGVDVVDCSSGGNCPAAPPNICPGYQVPFAQQIRAEAGIATMAVGLITTAEQAEQIVAQEQADLVAMGRELLRSPEWPLAAARELGQEVKWPWQYERGKLK